MTPKEQLQTLVEGLFSRAGRIDSAELKRLQQYAATIPLLSQEEAQTQINEYRKFKSRPHPL